MKQETGETRNAIIEDDEKKIQEILDANNHRVNPYWIVIFAKPAKGCVDGKPTLVKHIKAYDQKPMSQVGMIIGEVDNSKESIDWEVNMPQAPFDFAALGAEETTEAVVETSSIPHAYITK